MNTHFSSYIRPLTSPNALTQLVGDAMKLTDQDMPDLGRTAETNKTSQYLLAKQQTKSRKGVTMMKHTTNTMINFNTAITPDSHSASSPNIATPWAHEASTVYQTTSDYIIHPSGLL
jgi:hypothetical protein